MSTNKFNDPATVLKDAKWIAEDIDARPKDVANVACALAALSKQVDAALNPLKDRLRDMAMPLIDGDHGHVNWSVPNGDVSVTVPAPRYVLKRDADPEALREELGQDTFDLYFTTKVSYGLRKDIESVVKTRVASAEIPKVLAVIQRDDPTPRVGFKPSKDFMDNLFLDPDDLDADAEVL